MDGISLHDCLRRTWNALSWLPIVQVELQIVLHDCRIVEICLGSTCSSSDDEGGNIDKSRSESSGGTVAGVLLVFWACLPVELRTLPGLKDKCPIFTRFEDILRWERMMKRKKVRKSNDGSAVEYCPILLLHISIIKSHKMSNPNISRR